MAFCKNCGKEIDDNAVVCPHCGVIQKEELVQNTVDNGGFLWGLLGCCIPIGIGALVGVICVAVYYIVIIVIGVGLGVAGI